jgi:methylated-DNA-[protein]-cysteine S-methyltransferase
MNSDSRLFDVITDTPLGPVGIRLEQGRVVELGFLPEDTPPRAVADGIGAEAVQQLQAYFAHPGFRFTTPVKLTGTDFQLRVWRALREIPSGSVLTYGELAKKLDTGPRAVGGACRANPCPILVPCHRVVAAHGRGGYAGATSGRWPAIKEWLLQHEGATPPR